MDSTTNENHGQRGLRQTFNRIGKDKAVERSFKSPNTRKSAIGRFAVIPEMFLYYGKHLSTSAKVVYVVLLLHYNDGTYVCTPSVKTICVISGLGKTTVNKALNELEKFEWLVRIERKDGKFKKLSKQKHLTYPIKQIMRDGQNRLIYRISPTIAEAAAYRKKPTLTEVVVSSTVYEDDEDEAPW